MQELKSWIGAQLKRGYTQQQIKKVLISKGYPPKAVAEVDKIANKKAPSLSNIHIVIIGVVIIIGIALYFSGAKFGAEKEFLSLEEAVDKSGYPEGYVEQLAKDGKIGSKTEDDIVYISSKDLEKHMQEIKQVPEVLQPQPPEDLQPPEIAPLNEPEVPGVLPVKGFSISEPALDATPVDSAIPVDPLASEATIIESVPESTP